MSTPSTKIRFCLKKDFFPSGLAYCPRVSDGNVYRKRIFSKTLSTVEIFYNAGYSFTCGWTKTEVFEYDDVMHHIRVDGRKRFEYATFLITEKKISIFELFFICQWCKRMYLCGSVVLWLCGSVALWLCGFVCWDVCCKSQ